MLVPACTVKEVLRAKLIEQKQKEKNKFYWTASYNDFEFEIKDTDWNEAQFACIDSDGNISGFVEFRLDRGAMIISSFGFLSFYGCNPNIILIRDFISKLNELFEFGFRKAAFSATIGNPIVKTYDKMMERMPNGRVVGVYKDHIKLPDGKYYDKKLYEILNPKVYTNYGNV